jgi:hypothetical protein
MQQYKHSICEQSAGVDAAVGVHSQSGSAHIARRPIVIEADFAAACGWEGSHRATQVLMEFLGAACR